MSRAAALQAFLHRAGWADAERRPLAGDASFRRYDRLRRGGETAVLMDAPPPQEDVRPFVRVARLLGRHGVSVPNVLAEDAEQGFLLLDDLGDLVGGRVLAEQQMTPESFYLLATDALIDLHRNFSAASCGLPAFTDARAIDETCRLLEWYWPARFGTPCPEGIAAEYRAAWAAVLPAWRGVPDGFVHFDFFVDNLVWLPGRAGSAACGMLDFQDAVTGPVPFDLMSLLQDVRRDVPTSIETAMVERYLAAFPALDRAAFAASYAVGGAQRNARIAGVFVRLWQRDGKPHYLKFMPRVWSLLERNLAHPALAPLRTWFDRHVPPPLRHQPLPGQP